MTTLGTRLALAELDDIRTDLGSLVDRLDAVTAVLGGDVLDLRDKSPLTRHDVDVPSE